jgi:probable rRNA maturation factor
MPASNTRKASNRRKRSNIVVEVINQQRRRIPRAAIARAVHLVLESGRWSKADISVAVVNASTMRRLNRSFLGHDYVTDVLSFVYQRNARQKTLLGEIVVCADQAWKMASRQTWLGSDELVLYVIHGVLHLIGYNDDTAVAQRRMRAAERKFVRALGLRALPSPVEKSS